MEFAKTWPSKLRKGGRSSWLLGYSVPSFMGSRANGEMNSSSVLPCKGRPIYKDVLVAFKRSYSSITDELGTVQPEEMKFTESQNYFIPVFSFGGVIEGNTKCTWQMFS